MSLVGSIPPYQNPTNTHHAQYQKENVPGAIPERIIHMSDVLPVECTLYVQEHICPYVPTPIYRGLTKDLQSQVGNITWLRKLDGTQFPFRGQPPHRRLISMPTHIQNIMHLQHQYMTDKIAQEYKDMILARFESLKIPIYGIGIIPYTDLVNQMYSTRPDFGFYDQTDSQRFGAVLKRYARGAYGQLGEEDSVAQLWTDMYTDPTTNNATHIHMLSLATLAAALIYLDTPNPPAPLLILPPIAPILMTSSTHVCAMIAGTPSKTPCKDAAPAMIDMHTSSRNLLTSITMHANMIGLSAPLPHNTIDHTQLLDTGTRMAHELHTADTTKSFEPRGGYKTASMLDGTTSNTGAAPAPHTPRHLSKSQCKKLAKNAAAYRRNKAANRPSKLSSSGKHNSTSKKADAKLRRAQKKLRTRAKGPRRFD